MGTQKTEWPETEKFLDKIESITLGIEPRLLKVNLLDFVRSPAENKERQLTAMTRRMEVGTKDRAAAIKYREQEIRLKKMGYESAEMNIKPIQDFLGISQTMLPLEQNEGSRKIPVAAETTVAKSKR